MIGYKSFWTNIYKFHQKKSKGLDKLSSCFGVWKNPYISGHFKIGLETSIFNFSSHLCFFRLVNEAIITKFENYESMCTFFVYCYIASHKIKQSFISNVYIFFIFFIFLFLNFFWFISFKGKCSYNHYIESF